jgi:hypothetical protein
MAENEDRIAGFAHFRPARDEDEDPPLIAEITGQAFLFCRCQTLSCTR